MKKIKKGTDLKFEGYIPINDHFTMCTKHEEFIVDNGFGEETRMVLTITATLEKVNEENNLDNKDISLEKC